MGFCGFGVQGFRFFLEGVGGGGEEEFLGEWEVGVVGWVVLFFGGFLFFCESGGGRIFFGREEEGLFF